MAYNPAEIPPRNGPTMGNNPPGSNAYAYSGSYYRNGMDFNAYGAPPAYSGSQSGYGTGPYQYGSPPNDNRNHQSAYGGNHGYESGINSSMYIHPETAIEVRQGFIKKVFAIVICQLVITFGICAIPAFWARAAVYIVTGGYFIFYLSLASFVSVFIILCCFSQLMRKFPINYVILGVLSVAFGGILMYATAAIGGYMFLMAVGTTLVVTTALVLFASQTKYDFTGWGTYLLVVLLIAVVFSFFGIFVRSRTWDLVISCVMTLIFSMYIVYDTQLIFGGKSKKYQFGVDEYAFAALSLYIDIINLFAALVSILQLTQN